jgi:predicted 3-demethylubiquinone-9 3-methyltransferase (glyoxalase superfamily)
VQKIRPFLWFDTQAEEAAKFYTSIFKNSKIENIGRYGDAGPGDDGTVMSATFELEGQEFIALNGGPQFTFTPAISFFVSCETQEEVDYFWDRLLEGGLPNQCGWLTDKFGISWQIVPAILGELLNDEDDEKSSAVMQAMLKMVKLDIAGLKKAHEGASGHAAVGATAGN